VEERESKSNGKKKKRTIRKESCLFWNLRKGGVLRTPKGEEKKKEAFSEEEEKCWEPWYKS